MKKCNKKIYKNIRRKRNKSMLKSGKYKYWIRHFVFLSSLFIFLKPYTPIKQARRNAFKINLN